MDVHLLCQYGSSTSYVYSVNPGNGFYSGQLGVFQNGGGKYNILASGPTSSGGAAGIISSNNGITATAKRSWLPSGSGGNDWGMAAAAGGPSAAPAPSGGAIHRSIGQTTQTSGL